jgi:hypothetical protein
MGSHAVLVYMVDRLVRQIEHTFALGDEVQMRMHYAASHGRMRDYQLHRRRLENICTILERFINDYTVLAWQLHAIGLNHSHVNLN